MLWENTTSHPVTEVEPSSWVGQGVANHWSMEGLAMVIWWLLKQPRDKEGDATRITRKICYGPVRQVLTLENPWFLYIYICAFLACNGFLDIYQCCYMDSDGSVLQLIGSCFNSIWFLCLPNCIETINDSFFLHILSCDVLIPSETILSQHPPLSFLARRILYLFAPFRLGFCWTCRNS